MKLFSLKLATCNYVIVIDHRQLSTGEEREGKIERPAWHQRSLLKVSILAILNV